MKHFSRPCSSALRVALPLAGDGFNLDDIGPEIAEASVSTLAEPSAGALAELIRVMDSEGICTLVIETTAADQLARTLESELTGCDDVHVVTIYTDSLGPAGSGAETYIGMMRANTAALVEALR